MSGMDFLSPVRFTCLILSFTLPVLCQTLPDGPGKKELETLCGVCHGPEAVMGVDRMDRDGWQQKVFQMIGPGTASEQPAIKAILDYLVTNLGPTGGKPVTPDKTKINEAGSKELESTLSLTPPVAEALVRYRQANGKFGDLADLKKALAAIMAKIADEKKDVLSF
jgi:DNA uptake protein ComE-like DNA-binding protein